MKFLLDENLPGAETLFAPFGELSWFSGRVPPTALLSDADVLLVRSVTAVDSALLDQAQQLKFVGTATIGTEHIDTSTLKERDIAFASAPGSNAIAVGEYVLGSLLAVTPSLKGLTAAIIGAGHTGTEAARCLSAFGVRCVFYDPPKQRLIEQNQLTDPRLFVNFEEVFECDIVSCHVPLTDSGPDATYHLLDQQVINCFKSGTIVVNASRGAVIDNTALLKRQRDTNDLHVILDVWENEPAVIRELVPYIEIATPHIAGHSMEGKIRGVYSLYRAAHAYFNWPVDALDINAVLPQKMSQLFQVNEGAPEEDLRNLIIAATQVLDDDHRFRQHGLDANGFDSLRRSRRGRREFSAYSVNAANPYDKMLADLGFHFQR